MAAFVLAFSLMVIWQIPSLAAGEKGVSAEIKVSQNFEVKNGNNPAAGAGFEYQLTALTAGIPVPDGTDEAGVYHFELDGKDEINIHVDYAHAGFYQYQIEPVISKEYTGYTYDKSVYIANVHVKNSSQGLETTVVITNPDDEKIENIVYQHTYEVEDNGLVKTGDDARPMMYAILCCASMLVFFVVIKRREEDPEDVQEIE